MVRTKAMNLPRFDRHPDVARKGCLPAKDIVEALSNYPLFRFVCKRYTKQKPSKNRENLRRLNDNISITVCTGGTQRIHEGRRSLPSHIRTAKSEHEFSTIIP